MPSLLRASSQASDKHRDVLATAAKESEDRFHSRTPLDELMSDNLAMLKKLARTLLEEP